jgi:integrase
MDLQPLAFLGLSQKFPFVAFFVAVCGKGLLRPGASDVMASSKGAFRVGKVQGYQRGKVWYLCYFENGQRKRPRVGLDRKAAQLLAAQTHEQLERGAPSSLSFQPISVTELRQRWLEHHEQVLRSSVASVRRYRAATDHLLAYLNNENSVRLASMLTPQHAEAFVVYLRQLEKAPNGHPKARKRPLRDKGIKFILQVCRSMFTYARSRRHLSPYGENPFSVIGIDRIPIEDAKPIHVLNAKEEATFLKACDDWEFPLFLTLILTGMRPGELTHLLLPEDCDLIDGWLRIRNKLELGWQVKTRNERNIPLVSTLMEVLRLMIGERQAGPVFVRKYFDHGTIPPLAGRTSQELRVALAQRENAIMGEQGRRLSRSERLKLAAGIWRDAGAADVDRIRNAFIRRMKQIGLPDTTAPKLLRHTFATCLQDANVDPLIRNELMGHRPAQEAKAGGGLGMTAVYTHSRPETVRQQLQQAMERREIVNLAREWVAARQPKPANIPAASPSVLEQRADNADALDSSGCS